LEPLEFGLRILYLLGQMLYHLSQASSPFCFAYFLIEFHVYGWISLDHMPLIYAFCIAGMTDSYHHTQLYWLSQSVINVFLRLTSNCYPTNLCLPSTWNCRHEPSHLAQYVSLTYTIQTKVMFAVNIHHNVPFSMPKFNIFLCQDFQSFV
jgi:hypothetical protein